VDVSDLPNIFYVDGPAGTGKTYLYHAVFHAVRALGLIVLTVASSGIASLLLPRGRIAHSRFGLPVPVPLEGCVCSVGSKSARARVLRAASVFVWDEAPTAPRAVWNAVDKLLRDLRSATAKSNAERPFGGALMLLGGDIRQTTPVLPRVPPENVIDHTLVRTSWWRDPRTTCVHVLRRNMRARGDPRFAAQLLAVGEGRARRSNEDAVGMRLRLRDNVIPLPTGVTAPPAWTGEDLLTWVYDGRAERQLPELPDFYAERLVLSPTNVLAQALNDAMLARLDPSTERVHWSTDTAVAETEAKTPCPDEFLHSLVASGLPPHELRVRVGAVLILLRNFATRRGLCNGTRVLVLRLLKRSIVVRVITGEARGTDAILPRIFCDGGGSCVTIYDPPRANPRTPGVGRDHQQVPGTERVAETGAFPPEPSLCARPPLRGVGPSAGGTQRPRGRRGVARAAGEGHRRYF